MSLYGPPEPRQKVEHILQKLDEIQRLLNNIGGDLPFKVGPLESSVGMSDQAPTEVQIQGRRYLAGFFIKAPSTNELCIFNYMNLNGAPRDTVLKFNPPYEPNTMYKAIVDKANHVINVLQANQNELKERLTNLRLHASTKTINFHQTPGMTFEQYKKLIYEGSKVMQGNQESMDARPSSYKNH